MISAWNLLWIIPISASAGAVCMGLAVSSANYEHAREQHEIDKK